MGKVTLANSDGCKEKPILIHLFAPLISPTKNTIKIIKSTATAKVIKAILILRSKEIDEMIKINIIDAQIYMI